MKFKVGDKVRVRRDLNIKMSGVVDDMLQYKNKEMTIEKNDEGCYKLVEDYKKWCWTDDMLNKIRNTKTNTKNGVEDGDIVRAVCTGDLQNKLGIWHKSYIEFFEYINGHNGDGKGEYGYCWYLPKDEYILEPLDKVNVYDKDKILFSLNESKSWFEERNILTLFNKCKCFSLKDILHKLENDTECELLYRVIEENENILILRKDDVYFRITEDGIKLPKVDDNVELTKQLMQSINDLGKKIEERSPFQDAMTQAIIEKGKELATEDLKKELMQNLNDFIEKNYGVLPTKIIVENKEIKKDLTGLFHKDFEKICKIVNSNVPLMLVGGAGAGKNHTLEQVSEALGLTFYTTNAVNQDYKLTGFIDANGIYHETEFYKAFTNGGMFFLDEIDASYPEALIILNGAIANKYFDFPIGRVIAHKDFRVVCAGNTYGTGADMVYVGRNVLDGATLDRFVVMNFDYDENVEKALAYDNELFTFIRDLRKAVNESGLRYIVSMRALINSTKLLEIGIDKATILKTTIIKNMQVDDLNTVVKKIKHKNDWYNELIKMSDIND
jgi:MoxR-like ATPase